MRKIQPGRRYLELAQKWLDGTILPEVMRHAKWYNAAVYPNTILKIPSHIATDTEQHGLLILPQIIFRKAPLIPIDRYARRITVAIILVLFTGACFYFNASDNLPAPAFISSKKNNVKKHTRPGNYVAMHTSGSSKAISPDIVKHGTFFPAPDIAMTNADRNLIIKAGSSHYKTIEYYTLFAPRGRQLELVLPDGMAVWLNAQSSISLPTQISGSGRSVEVTGEAFFEIAKDISKLFIVRVKEAEIAVLGKHFTEMAYNNEIAFEKYFA